VQAGKLKLRPTAAKIAGPYSLESAATAGVVLVMGSAMPRASMHVDMVLAVNMPLHVPEPGHEWHSTPCNSSMSILSGFASES